MYQLLIYQLISKSSFYFVTTPEKYFQKALEGVHVINRVDKI